ncbi:hypothetical protein Sinac_2150 [Singulisphaera acidiphila DSM 18658]|uniref:Uncharacterized protein n=1 Tax=Singulisphaera acidiphila (strain ATCC BAA-1392 / DSM 18658 / VKM B-2454 / MOB10) TaxID=886293 RepID=L0DCC2_SINAD|nr:hypothetical protein Sinac_2150 [Singulisphaera acidiphila DSM 18658]
MGGVCRDLKYGCQIYEYHKEKAVLIDPGESFLVELARDIRRSKSSIGVNRRDQRGPLAEQVELRPRQDSQSLFNRVWTFVIRL